MRSAVLLTNMCTRPVWHIVRLVKRLQQMEAGLQWSPLNISCMAQQCVSFDRMYDAGAF